MGKSAGKWIKTVLFGKKHSKSNSSKKATPDKTSLKTPVEEVPTNSPVISDPCQLTERGVETLELEKGASGTPCDIIDLSHVNQGADSLSNNASLQVSDAEISKQEQAATKAQAAFKGYLARRAFRALKGIIRLQALIRGHLVRRQAVATLCCMQAIVKLQALARGQKVDIGANSFFGSEKLVTNAFVHKLLFTVPTAMPLSFQYDLAEPNSAWNWLERWSVTHFWKAPAPTKRIMKMSQKKQGGAQVLEPEAGKSRRTVRKVSAVANGENGVLASFEMDKTKRNTRKVTSNQTELVQEQPQNELERVKCNLRKISALAASEKKSETENEKMQPLQSVEIATNYAPPDVCKLELVTSENLADSDIVVDKLDLLEAPSKTTMDEPVDVTLKNHPAVEIHSLKNGLKMERSLTLDNELSCKEEQNGKENHKIQKRRSLPAMQESPENISQKSQSLPSYMAATESAKAKLRAQGSSKFDEDGTEHGVIRRHSLPASTNGKLSSSSPRLQKHVQANGKGGKKINGLLTSSSDDKVLQPGWRR